jgi:hypothetical protein
MNSNGTRINPVGEPPSMRVFIDWTAPFTALDYSMVDSFYEIESETNSSRETPGIWILRKGVEIYSKVIILRRLVDIYPPFYSIDGETRGENIRFWEIDGPQVPFEDVAWWSIDSGRHLNLFGVTGGWLTSKTAKSKQKMTNRSRKKEKKVSKEGKNNASLTEPDQLNFIQFIVRKIAVSVAVSVELMAYRK